MGTGAATAMTLAAGSSPAAAQSSTSTKGSDAMSTITTTDDVTLYYKDWGPKDGPAVTLSHGWPLSADSWENLAFFLASEGYRVVAHDRRGHGRSSQPWDGNDMDHYADDLATVIETLDLRDASIIGFSTGGGEVARYVGRHGTGRVAKIGLISAVTPVMVQSETNPDGVPIEVFDGIRAAFLASRAKLFRDLPSGPFYNYDRPGAEPDQGLIDFWWLQGMQGGFKNTYDSIKAFSETDLTEDLRRFDKPTLIIHGDDDQVVPIDTAARAVKRLVPHAELKVYEGAPHGLPDTHRDRFHQDVLAFLKS
ncbi:alpha/beta fold hydrolase [Marinivivus vitaminiproducens]|uniref:alpha/beta fold hydrolase n=1 Tax=Marinivivus vitaminiproducens TaxID=3035935 RepID=UPI003FA098C6